MIGGQIIAEVRKLAEQYPNGRYVPVNEGEFYSYVEGHVADGPATEGCIIGQAFVRCGMASVVRTVPYNTKIEDVLDGTNQLTPWEIHWLQEVQQHQDGGETWDVAVLMADL